MQEDIRTLLGFLATSCTSPSLLKAYAELHALFPRVYYLRVARQLVNVFLVEGIRVWLFRGLVLCDHSHATSFNCGGKETRNTRLRRGEVASPAGAWPAFRSPGSLMLQCQLYFLLARGQR